MTEEDYARKLDEVDHVLNDPDVPVQPALIWRRLRTSITTRPRVAAA